MEKGLIHLYTGDGKGKTTAAMGLLLRAAGSGLRVMAVQFQKGRESGEVAMLGRLGIQVLRNSRDFGFVKNMSPEDKQEITAENTANLKQAIREASEGRIALLVLDELMAAYRYGLIDTAMVRNFIQNKPVALELVLTGRNADTFFLEHSDYITQMQEIRHPFQKGITARKGIEY